MLELATATSFEQGSYMHHSAELAVADWRDFFSLLKPRVMSLVVFSGLCGLLAAPGDIHPLIATIAVLCIAVGAGAAGAFNMWYEADSDALMTRTAARPLPAGRISRSEAFAFAMILAVASVLLMGLAANWHAALWLAVSILFYVFVYTIWLKRRTPQNIVIGGAAGAFPPLIGWAAVTGGTAALPWLMFALIFLWTPPHFWALALYMKSDYSKAGIPMMPVVAGEESTRKQIWVYTLAMALCAVLPWVLQLTGPIYGIAALAFNILFIAAAWPVYRVGDVKACKRLFGVSILYLFLLMGALALDRMMLA
jgi:heme o synthase